LGARTFLSTVCGRLDTESSAIEAVSQVQRQIDELGRSGVIGCLMRGELSITKKRTLEIEEEVAKLLVRNGERRGDILKRVKETKEECERIFGDIEGNLMRHGSGDGGGGEEEEDDGG